MSNAKITRYLDLPMTTGRTPIVDGLLADESNKSWVREHQVRVLERAYHAAIQELERERLRLAACGVAALGYHPKEGVSAEYRSASLDGVLSLRERCDELEAPRGARPPVPHGEPTHYCARCGTAYFAEGECDWCPHAQLFLLAAKGAERCP